jgi:hypothetical protein
MTPGATAFTRMPFDRAVVGSPREPQAVEQLGKLGRFSVNCRRRVERLHYFSAQGEYT